MGYLRLRFQPIVAMADGRLRGLEALARLSRPDGAIIGPDQFVPQIEQAGLGDLLADQVSDRAMADIAHAIAAEVVDKHMRVGINLPLDAMLAPGTVDWLGEVRQRHGVAAGSVVLELTESQPITDLPALRAAVGALREAGYRIAIDDAVPDMPDLAALMDMPFSVVKLDKSLARGALDGGPGGRFIDRIVAAGRRHGMNVIAEGIEDRETWVSLRDRGVDCGQGYWVSRPLPYADLADWIASWNQRRAELP